MGVKKKKIPGPCGREYTLFVETYRSCAEVISVGKSRPLSHSDWRPDDFFDPSIEISDPHFTGVDSNEELWHMVKCGTDDIEFLKGLKKYAMAVQVREADKLATRHRDMVGGSVDVPRFLSGAPDNMWSLKKKRVKTKIVDLAVDLTVSAYISRKEFSSAGKAICMAMSKVEKAGYRVRLHGVVSVAKNYSAKRVVSMNIILKNDNEATNYRKIAYALSNVSFFRGLGFAWLVRNPNAEYAPLLGVPATTLGDVEWLDTLSDAICGRKCVHVEMTTLVRRVGYGTDEQIDKVVKEIEANLLSLG